MTLGSIGEQAGPRSSGIMGHVYRVISHKQILAAPNNKLTIRAPFSRGVVRSDFPVQVTVDDAPIGPSGDPGSPWFRIDREAKTFTFEILGNFGNQTESNAYGWSGQIWLEGSPGDQLEHIVPAPWHLPTRTFVHTSTWAAATSNIVSRGVTTWYVNGKLPAAIWITGVTVIRELGVTPHLPIAKSLATFRMEVGNVPAGHVHQLLAVQQGAAGASAAEAVMSRDFPYLYVPLHDIYSQFAAETPVINFAHYGDAGAAGEQVTTRFTAAYRFGSPL